MKHILCIIILLLPLFCHAENTLRIYLSGHGCDDMVPWEFYCTGGRQSGQWTTIGVPSCWEMQGFGTLQYGYWFNEWNKQPHQEPIADEKGIYRCHFSIPAEWLSARSPKKGATQKNIRIVFEASMTDTDVKINGKPAGERHRGGFSTFSYDITKLVRGGDNLLEVTVSKESDNPNVNHAERRADYWNFGGIVRPVYLEVKPLSNIERAAIDAQMDGLFRCDVFTDGGIGDSLRVDIADRQGNIVARQQCLLTSDSTRMALHVDKPSLWTAETPYLYTAQFSLIGKDGQDVHEVKERFGFRTVELREHDGLYVNGKAIKLKGVNRHSFRPETGRTLSKAKNLEDVLLIKSLNMNAVRLSHYPADPDFYDICDSLGLYVLDEVTGWQHPHDTITGSELVRELVTRDVNHPSVIMWDSGNEGGFNYALEPVFHRYDIQKRMVIYPWSKTRNGISTRHYRSYWETEKILRTGDVFMPTEFLHSAYDGGGGAGLEDYWNLMKQYRNSAGGFIWALVDEGVSCKSSEGADSIDCASNLAPDGIVGPHHEHEASYYTVKQLWSPVQPSYHDGILTFHNEYDFSNLNTCRYGYRFLRFDCERDTLLTVSSDSDWCPDALPGDSATMALAAPAEADVLALTITNSNDDTLYTWQWQLKKPTLPTSITVKKIKLKKNVVSNHGVNYVFSESTGYLEKVEVNGHVIAFGNGPRVAAFRRADRIDAKGARLDRKLAANTKEYVSYVDSAGFRGFSIRDSVLTAHYSGGFLQEVKWTFLSDGSVRLNYSYNLGGHVADLMGIVFDYPESKVTAKRWLGMGPYRVWQNRTAGPQYGLWQNDYNDALPGERFDYPEFKGYFANVDRMQLVTTEGEITMQSPTAPYIGVYTPRDGRDHFLFNFPNLDIAFLKYIPAIRNKVDYSDLNGPHAQPLFPGGTARGHVVLKFNAE